MKDDIYITKAIDAGGLRVHLVFSDGVERTVDVGSFIRRHPHPMYNKFLDPQEFAKFKLEDGNIYWGKDEALAFHIENLHSGSIMA